MNVIVKLKTQKLMERFEVAQQTGDIDRMIKVVKRLGYKQDCPPETVTEMRRQTWKRIEQREIVLDPKTRREI
ncbi:hypothetical protein HZC07_00630 [Candidatus Micrarchaeota archaeon]|nr:hypothetical protein [Candidatus Micrarchaeota archaeon]